MWRNQSLAESDKSTNKNYSVLNIISNLDDERKELKKRLISALGEKLFWNLLVVSASLVSFFRNYFFHKMKLRYPYLTIFPVKQSIKGLYCGFFDNAIKITGNLVIPVFSNGWSHEECHFFASNGHNRNTLEYGNMRKMELEVSTETLPSFLVRNDQQVYKCYFYRQKYTFLELLYHDFFI